MVTESETVRSVVTIDPGAGVFRARALMSAHEIRHLPVVDDEGRIVGIITDRDIRSVAPSRFDHETDAARKAEEFSKLRVADVMTPNPHTISIASTLQDVLARFREFKVGAFPVVDADNRVVGIVSERDLLQSFIHLLGIHRPGVFIGVRAGTETENVRDIVAAVAEAGVPLGSLLAVGEKEEGRRSVFLYLFAKNIGPAKKRLEEAGFQIIDPMEWFLAHFRLPSQGAS